MAGFEFAPGPTVSLREFYADKVFYLVESAVDYACVAAIRRKFQGYNRIRFYLFFHFQTCARRRNILQDAPFVAGLSGFRFPLNFDKISTKFPIFASLWYHD